jgi:hypothetical protein
MEMNEVCGGLVPPILKGKVSDKVLLIVFVHLNRGRKEVVVTKREDQL